LFEQKNVLQLFLSVNIIFEYQYKRRRSRNKKPGASMLVQLSAGGEMSDGRKFATRAALLSGALHTRSN